MTPSFYRSEAQRLRRLAAERTDRAQIDQLLRAAAEHDDIADQLEHPGIR